MGFSLEHLWLDRFCHKKVRQGMTFQKCSNLLKAYRANAFCWLKHFYFYLSLSATEVCSIQANDTTIDSSDLSQRINPPENQGTKYDGKYPHTWLNEMLFLMLLLHFFQRIMICWWESTKLPGHLFFPAYGAFSLVLDTPY